MRLPRLRTRTLMLAVAGLAAAFWASHHLIVGDGQVRVGFMNATRRTLTCVTLSDRVSTIHAGDFRPGDGIISDLHAGRPRPDGTLDAKFTLSFAIDGKRHVLHPRHIFDLALGEPNVRWSIVSDPVLPTLQLTNAHGRRIPQWQRRLRQLWFRGPAPYR